MCSTGARPHSSPSFLTFSISSPPHFLVSHPLYACVHIYNMKRPLCLAISETPINSAFQRGGDGTGNTRVTKYHSSIVQTPPSRSPSCMFFAIYLTGSYIFTKCAKHSIRVTK